LIDFVNKNLQAEKYLKLTRPKYLYPVIFLSLTMLWTVTIHPVFASDTEGRKTSVQPWTAALQTKYFFKSHTSYEFGNPFPPNQAPLSRLEFPLNSWWAGASLRREFSRFSVGAEVLRNLSGEAKDDMTDSDWDDDAQPDTLTIYSESSCRIEPSYIVHVDADLKISDWMGLPKWVDLRPAAGVTWQRFSLVTHDGVQSYPAPGDTRPPESLPGDGIRFEQTYWQFWTGLKAAFDLGKPFHLSGLKLQTQVDWAYVDAANEDYHMLSIGKRITNEKTAGNAWHALVNLKIGLTQNLNANIGAEYLRIVTTGSHRLVHETFGIDFTFENGVKVWSRQISATMGLEYSF